MASQALLTTGKHELGTVAHGVDGAVLDHETLVRAEQRLERADDPAEVRLVHRVVVEPLGVEDVVERDEALVLVHGTRPDTAELLHVSADAEEETEVHAEGTDVGTGYRKSVTDTHT